MYSSSVSPAFDLGSRLLDLHVAGAARDGDLAEWMML
jgi:hypothetical protein